MKNGYALITACMLLCGSALGCSGLDQSSTQSLRMEVDRFNQNLRWGRVRQASVQVDPALRERWVIQMERASRAFRILEYEARPVDVGPDRAVVHVDLAFHRANGVVIERVRREQVWERHDGWLLVSERRIERPVERLPTQLPEFGDS